MRAPLETIVDVLREAMELVTRPGTDVRWSRYKTPAEAAAELRRHLAALAVGDVSGVEGLGNLFAPTGPLQQIANDNGWEPHFMLLAAHVEASMDLMRENGSLPRPTGE